MRLNGDYILATAAGDSGGNEALVAAGYATACVSVRVRKARAEVVNGHEVRGHDGAEVCNRAQRRKTRIGYAELQNVFVSERVAIRIRTRIDARR